MAAPSDTTPNQSRSRGPGRGIAESEVVSYFWISTFPFFETTLFVAAPFPSSGEGLDVRSPPSRVQLFDADGGLVNELALEVEPGRVGVIELDQFLGGCKLESGLRHGQMRVASPAGTRHLCRLHGRTGASFQEGASRVTGQRSVFSPVVLATNLDNIICLVNRESRPAIARVRLLVGNRNPEAFIEVPADGARLVSVAAEFGEFVPAAGVEAVQGYVRLSSKGEADLGVQVLQRAIARDERFENDVYGLVS